MTEKMEFEDRIKEIKKRAQAFRLLQLPGQPQGIHMGTSYLVSDMENLIDDLWKEVKFWND